MSRALPWLIALGCLAVHPAARAGSPCIWETAVQPRLARDMAAMREAQRLFIEAHRSGPDFGGRRQMLAVALRVLERADAESSPDPRPRILYGRVLSRIAHDERPQSARPHLEKSALVLQEAIGKWPDHPEAQNARYALAVAWAKLQEPRKEIDVYTSILERETGREERALTLMNQAEAFMVLGDLERAAQGYRASIALEPDRALAHWGLAVALDRNADPGGALAEAWTALQYDPSAEALHSDNVFFVPEYDRFWYDALGAMARATHEGDPTLSSLWWKDAGAYWRAWLESAAAGSRWADSAQARRKHCERMEKQRASQAPRRPLRGMAKP